MAAKRLLARHQRREAQQESTEQASAALDLVALASDFQAFCKAIRIVDKFGRRVPLHHNAIQALFEVERTGRDIVLKPRQIGFTTGELARDLWTFLFKPGARVVVVCQSTADNGPAKLISGVLRVMLSGLREAGFEPTFLTEAWNEWVLDNGNSLRISVAGASEESASKKGRAGTITRLHLTETAFYEHARKTLTALFACVPKPETGSEIVIESTANGASGDFYEKCKSAQAGRGEYKFHFYPWYAHPEYATELAPGEELEPEGEAEERLAALGVSREQLKWRRLKIEENGLDAFNQEYPEDPESCFLVSGRGFFDAARTKLLIDLAENAKPLETRLQGRIRIWKRPDTTRRARYVLAVDPSEGCGADPSGGVLYDRDTGEHCATIDGQFMPRQLAEVSAKLAAEYSNALLVPERNNHGHAVIGALESIDPETKEPVYRNVYKHDDGKLGWPTNTVTRPQMLSELEDAVRKSNWRTSDSVLLSQLRTFVIKDGKPQGAPGSKDDLVMASAIGWAVRQRDWSGFENQTEEEDVESSSMSTFGLGGYGF